MKVRPSCKYYKTQNILKPFLGRIAAPSQKFEVVCFFWTTGIYKYQQNFAKIQGMLKLLIFAVVPIGKIIDI